MRVAQVRPGLSEPVDDALEKLVFLYKVHRGIEQADAGSLVSHAEAKARLAEWLD
ncbi:MAG: hypothetical protein AAGC60_06705 [Acidobacteriota bacterium]